MTRKYLFAAVLFSFCAILFTSSCNQDIRIEPLEPISLVHPDSAIVKIFAGDSTPVEIKFTTDRPINWVQGLYDIDTTGATTYTPTYPDTLFYQKLDGLSPHINLYTYTGVYTVPDSLKGFSVVYFDVSFNAGSSTFVVGQNYPAGIVTASKQFKINVR